MQRILLIDTCGEAAGVALCLGGKVLVTEEFVPGDASAQLVGAIGRLLHQLGWILADLDGVGVVSGPGSFTGVRTGMAVAKGLCEVAELPMVTVSRLEVLADATMPSSELVALDAGRGEVYVHEVATGREWLCGVEELATAQGLVVAEQRLAERLASYSPVLHSLSLADALPALTWRLKQGGCDVALADANYVRTEQNVYGKQVLK